MTTYASFKPSVQFLEAGEKAQQFANAANTFKPLLSQEARQSIEGIDKVSQAFTATGRALEHFGFDEAEPEVTTSEVELISTDDSQIADNIDPRFFSSVPESLRPSALFIEGGRALYKNGWEVTGEAIDTAGQVMRAMGYDEAEPDSITANSAANDPLTGPQPSMTNAVDDIEAEVVEDVGGRARFLRRGGKSTLFEDLRKWFGGDVDPAEFTTGQQGDLLTGITTNDENVGCSYVDKVTRPGYCEEMEKKYREGLLNTDEQQNAQFDAGQTITFDESGMDGLVAAGSIGDIDWRSWCFEQQGPCKPLDAMALNEPQTNNVF